LFKYLLIPLLVIIYYHWQQSPCGSFSFCVFFFCVQCDYGRRKLVWEMNKQLISLENIIRLAAQVLTHCRP